MNLLQYTSSEMFSSTELIRKSKKVFDSLNNKDIEKAIILRDGKPSFMLLDFETYEKIMNEYIQLKEQSVKSKKEVQKKKDPSTEEKKSIEEINEDDLQSALKEIEKLGLDENIDEKKEVQLEDFWN